MPLSDLIRAVRGMWRAWSWFWFKDISAKGTGIMRIVMGLILVMTTLDLFPLLPTLIGPEGVFHASSAERGVRISRWTWFDHLPTMGSMYVAHGLALVANVLFMLGFRSRTMGFISVLASAALYQRNSWFMNGGDRLVRELSFYICLVPCGAAFSVDAWLAKRKADKRGLRWLPAPTVPILAMRMIQLQLCLMYLSSGWQKFGSGTWERGSALFYALSSGNYMRSEALVAPLLNTEVGHKITEFLTHFTVCWEIGFTFMVLWRPTRWFALVAGVAMHVGTHVGLMVAYFSAASIWGYGAFLPYDWVEQLSEWRARKRRGMSQSLEE